MALYGFASEEERDLFLNLDLRLRRGAQGRDRDPLGRHRRASCCARSPPATHKRFQAVPGIGKRTAERVIVELREKVAERARGGRARRAGDADEPRLLAREGLIHLGYTLDEAERMLDNAPRARRPRS